jgi:hypothetical protein
MEGKEDGRWKCKEGLNYGVSEEVMVEDRT